MPSLNIDKFSLHWRETSIFPLESCFISLSLVTPCPLSLPPFAIQTQKKTQVFYYFSAFHLKKQKQGRNTVESKGGTQESVKARHKEKWEQRWVLLLYISRVNNMFTPSLLQTRQLSNRLHSHGTLLPLQHTSNAPF